MNIQEILERLENLPPILDSKELNKQMPLIHRAALNQCDEPHIPIIVERNLEIELTILQHEHYMEAESMSNFPGLTNDVINETIFAAQANKIIADIDGRGHLENPRPLDIEVRDIPSIINIIEKTA